MKTKFRLSRKLVITPLIRPTVFRTPALAQSDKNITDARRLSRLDVQHPTGYALFHYILIVYKSRGAPSRS